MSEFVPQGTVIADKYRIERPVARGGFSTVYLGIQIGLERPVALKLLDLTAGIDATWTARFEREAKLASNLSHPNTITIIDYGRSNQHLFMAMEFVRGRSLNKHLKKFGALDPMPVAQVALQVCRSLEEAHGFGILHRDLKPSNIMLAKSATDDPIVKVLDFGIAKVLEPTPDVDLQLTQQGVFVGTPRYAAPEQLVHEELDPRTDVYGVGMIMWEALVGDPAVPEIDYGACVERHLGPKPWLLPDWILCPPKLADIVHRALQKKKDNRYQSVTDLAQDLERFIKENAADADASIEVLRDAAEPSDMSIDLPGDEIFSGIGQAVSESEPEADALLLAPTRRENRTKRVELDPEKQPRKVIPKPDSKPEKPQSQAHLGKPAPKLELDREPVVSGTPVYQPTPSDTGEMVQKVRRTPAQPKKVPIGWWMGGMVALSLMGGIIWWVVWSNQGTRKGLDTSEDPVVEVETVIQESIVITALRTAGWKVRVGDTNSYMDGIEQTAISATKKGRRASLTLFDCKTKEQLSTVAAETPTGDYDIVFGNQLVRVKEAGNGSDAMKSTLAAIAEMGQTELSP